MSLLRGIFRKLDQNMVVPETRDDARFQDFIDLKTSFGNDLVDSGLI